MTLPRTFPAAFQQTVGRHPHNVALSSADGSVRITWRQYADRVEKLATGFAALGVKRGDTVGLMLTNRPGFHMFDAAAMMLGACPFSVYNTNPPEAIGYVMGDAGNPIVITQQQVVERRLQTDPGVVHAQPGGQVQAAQDQPLVAGADAALAFLSARLLIRPSMPLAPISWAKLLRYWSASQMPSTLTS